MNNKHYEITLFDFESKATAYVKPQDELGDFINGINWMEVSHIKVDAIEPLADWELELLNGGWNVEVDNDE